MPTPILPYDEWQAGTLQNSVPANTNALRSEALAANVISDATTAQPASPADGDCYIIPAGATGAQWATFAEGSLALFRAGTWYEFTAYDGLLKVVAGEVKINNGSAWEVYGGGGGGGSNSISVEENGVLVAADVTTVNFAGSNVNVIDAGSGQVDVEIPSGGGGGSDPWTYIVLSSDFESNSTTPSNVTGFSVSPVANKVVVVEGVLLMRTSIATAGPRPGLSFPTGIDGVASINVASSISSLQFANGNQANEFFISTNGLATIDESWGCILSATMVGSGSVSGSLFVTFRSENTSVVTLRSGSWIRYRTIN